MVKLDFAEIKRTVSFEQAADLLGLTLKRTKPNQLRGECPCGQGGDRALCLTEGAGFYCWGSHASGSVLDFVMHARQCTDVEAARFLTGTVDTVPSTVSTRRTVPESEGGEKPKKFQPLSYLEPSHAAVDAVGFSAEFATKHGIGYAPRGTMRGYVLIPFRDDLGNLLGYVGVTDAKLPADFTPNIVNFPKSA